MCCRRPPPPRHQRTARRRLHHRLLVRATIPPGSTNWSSLPTTAPWIP
jgi:hypothetical protein